VVLSQLGLLERTRVLDLGCAIAAAVPHQRLPGLESAGPARSHTTRRTIGESGAGCGRAYFVYRMNTYASEIDVPTLATRLSNS
jgi:hypothetical protein